jgi:hypothetical protein
VAIDVMHMLKRHERAAESACHYDPVLQRVTGIPLFDTSIRLGHFVQRVMGVYQHVHIPVPVHVPAASPALAHCGGSIQAFLDRVTPQDTADRFIGYRITPGH